MHIDIGGRAPGALRLLINRNFPNPNHMTRSLLLSLLGWIVLCVSAHGSPLSPSLAAVTAAAPPFFQTSTVTGAVTDETGSALPGVNVIVKGTSNGTTTDSDGKYTIRLEGDQANGTLVYSFIGFKPQEVAVGGRSSIDVSM